LTPETRAVVLMIFAMGAFAGVDTFMKLLTHALPVFEVVFLTSLGGALVFGLMTLLQGQRLWTRAFLAPAVMFRNASEVVGSIAIISALALAPLSLVTAINQSTPLIVTAGGALFLGEAVGLRRWSGVVIGFVGVVVMLQPDGSAGWPGMALAVLAALGMSARDLATRRLPAEVSTVQAGFWGLSSLVLAASAPALIQGWAPLTPWLVFLALSGVLTLVLAYYALTASLRLAAASSVAPYRYTRILFALVIGLVILGERPGLHVYLGAALVVGSGLYVFARQRRKATVAG